MKMPSGQRSDSVKKGSDVTASETVTENEIRIMTVTAIESVTRHKMRVSLDGEPAFVFTDKEIREWNLEEEMVLDDSEKQAAFTVCQP